MMWMLLGPESVIFVVVVYKYVLDTLYVLFEETGLFCICLTYLELHPRNMRTTVDTDFRNFIWTVFAHHCIPCFVLCLSFDLQKPCRIIIRMCLVSCPRFTVVKAL